ncbi:MAG: hypothetical protein Q9227_000190 [Pyrenula ochraceoflavens]
MHAYINDFQTSVEQDPGMSSTFSNVSSDTSALHRGRYSPDESAEAPVVKSSSRATHSRKASKSRNRDTFYDNEVSRDLPVKAPISKYSSSSPHAIPIPPAKANYEPKITDFAIHKSTHHQNSSHGSSSSGLRSPRKSSISSSADTFDTEPTSISTRPRLSEQNQRAEPKASKMASKYIEQSPVDDFDLQAPFSDPERGHSIEMLLDMLCSTEHMTSIFEEPSSLEDFAAYIRTARPQSLPLLTYYMDTSKAMKALDYANAIAKTLQRLDKHDFSSQQPEQVTSLDLSSKASAAFQELVRIDLPPYLTHKYCQAVESIMINKIIDNPNSPDPSIADGITEVFCLTDPTRDDNPVVFASRGFCEITQYGLNYVNGRNCRFLQGPRTNPANTMRLKQAIDAGESHAELILNYRRDGSPFINLLMQAPLRDLNGRVRYFLGAQIDITGLVRNSLILDGETEQHDDAHPRDDGQTEGKTKFQKTTRELRNLRQQIRNADGADHDHTEVRLLTALWNRHLVDPAVNTKPASRRRDAVGYYEHWLLIRPSPSLRILFASPSLSPSSATSSTSILQTPLMDSIHGNARLRAELEEALAQGRNVTAKVKWQPRKSAEGTLRWIAFTPLLGSDGRVGVWVGVMVDEEEAERVGGGVEEPRFDVRGAVEGCVERERQRELKGEIRAKAADSKPETAVANMAKEMAPVRITRDLYEIDDAVSVKSMRSVATQARDMGKDREDVPPLPRMDSGGSGSVSESLEERLRKKRARDAERLRDGGASPGGGLGERRTYKTFSPFVPE